MRQSSSSRSSILSLQHQIRILPSPAQNAGCVGWAEVFRDGVFGSCVRASVRQSSFKTTIKRFRALDMSARHLRLCTATDPGGLAYPNTLLWTLRYVFAIQSPFKFTFKTDVDYKCPPTAPNLNVHHVAFSTVVTDDFFLADDSSSTRYKTHHTCQNYEHLVLKDIFCFEYSSTIQLFDYAWTVNWFPIALPCPAKEKQAKLLMFLNISQWIIASGSIIIQFKIFFFFLRNCRFTCEQLTERGGDWCVTEASSLKGQFSSAI